MFIISILGILGIWILLYIIIRKVMLGSISAVQKRDIKKHGIELFDYERDKEHTMIYITGTFIAIPLVVILMFFDKAFDEWGIVPFSTSSWLVGSVIVGGIWVLLITFIFIKGMRQIKLQEKKDKKGKLRKEYYDDKRWKFGTYTIAIGIGVPIIVLTAWL